MQSSSMGVRFLRAQGLHTWLLVVVLYAVAVALRWLFVGVPPESDEGAFYWIASQPPSGPSLVHDLYAPDEYTGVAAVLYRPIPIFWYRPLHFLLLWPGAQFSFEGYRMLNALLTALIAPASWFLLRAHGIRWPAAFLGALGTTLVPVVVVWSTFGLADGLSTLLVIVALWMHQRDRPVVSGVAWAAAIWTKEVAIIGLAVLLLIDLLRGIRKGESRIWPLRLTPMQTSWLMALGIGAFPTIITLVLGGITPGGFGDNDIPRLVDALVVSAWLWPILLGGLFWSRTRQAAVVGLLYPVWFLFYAIALRHGVNIWYLVLPNVLALLAATAIIDRWITNAQVPRDSKAFTDRDPLKIAGLIGAVVLFGVVVGHAAVPNDPVNDRLLEPVSGMQEDDFRETYRYHHNRDQELLEVASLVHSVDRPTLFFVDVYGADALYPLGEDVASMHAGSTPTVRFFDQRIDPWPQTVQGTTWTVIQINQEPLNVALRETYSECTVLVNPVYVVLEGDRCDQPPETLLAAYDEAVSGLDN